MSDGGTAFEPDMEELRAPFRSRNSYAGHRAFGSGEGAVLVDPKVTRALRYAAEAATQERRVTGGLLYGTAWADDQGLYQVIDGYIEAGPGENRGDRIAADGTDNFSLSDADLRLLREDGARMYSASFEVGWWRTLPGPGEFGPLDFETQGQLGPDGVGLLVFGSTPQWGTAYLGPDGRAPDSAGTLVAIPEPAAAPPAAAPRPVPAAEPELVDIAAGQSLTAEPLPAGGGPAAAGPAPASAPPRRRARRLAAPQGVPLRRRARPPAPARVGAGTRRWVARRAAVEGPPETPADVQLVVIALAIVFVAAAIIIGVLVHSVIVAVIIAAIGLLVVFGSVWFSRR